MMFTVKGEEMDTDQHAVMATRETTEDQHPSKGSTVGASQSAETEMNDESSRLRSLLQGEIRNQDDLERDITRQADKLLNEQEDERDQRRLERTQREKEKLAAQVLKLHQRVSQPIGTSQRVRLNNEIDKAEARIVQLEEDLKQIQDRIDERGRQGDEVAPTSGTGKLPNESRRDYLIRTGKITPFSKFGGGVSGGTLENLQDALIDAEDEGEEEAMIAEARENPAVSHRNLVVPSFGSFDDASNDSSSDFAPEQPAKRRRLQQDSAAEPASRKRPTTKKQSKRAAPVSDDEYDDSGSFVASGESEPDVSDDEEFMPETLPPKRPRKIAATSGIRDDSVQDISGLDDGNENLYQSRLQNWVRRRAEARKRAASRRQQAGEADADGTVEAAGVASDPAEEEWFLPHPTIPDTLMADSYYMPGDVFPYLFDYQKTGVQWLFELYQQQVGGIIGDEMGLGKTIQVISFLAGLHHSKKITKPIIVVCPATVMKQWVNEFHRWWPPFRVSILHTSGSGMIDVKRESRREDDLTSQMWDPQQSQGLTKGQKAAKRILKRVVEEGHVLVTTYSGLQSYAQLLIPVEWECAILDEGHKIRNPNTAITIYCKELRTPNRVILSGTPMQNNLTELWSLFDFVFPMRLGTLVNFRNQFEFPIRQGGYANASNLQVQTAARCAETLKDAISPYLLQRFKVDVAADLPKKSEQVLFCKLTKQQRQKYEAFLRSDDMSAIMQGKRQVLFGVDLLRKICNHPDLVDHKNLSAKSNSNYGSGSKSGKMQVVKSLLELWRDTGHKTLLFAQHRIMLDILERFVKSLPGFNYRRMDGTTPIHRRQGLVDEFNDSPDLHVFLLTTKVGGLGVNLTGADRVIIYDPDWNPSTDIQARERAWRLGQKREVTIYRLMTAGTIEEKIYHRQIFKQFLTNKILKDPKQRQTFQMNDLYDLFTLGNEGPTQTSEMFKDAEVTYQEDQAVDDKGKQARDAADPAGSKEPDESKDISKVVGVASMERFQGDPNTPQDSEAESGTPAAEARLMEGIFARSGVHSALEHDQIVNGRRAVRADPKIIEAEAKRVAAEAAQELQKAGELARSIPIGTPTWTGQFGVSGRPEDGGRATGPASLFEGNSSTVRRGRGAIASSRLIANLARANGSRSGSPSPSQPRGRGFMVMIRDYLQTHGGRAYTQMLVNHFSAMCDTPQASAEFKEMLKQIAVLERGDRGQGQWVLKQEYTRKR